MCKDEVLVWHTMNSDLHLLKWEMWKWSVGVGQQVKIKYGMCNYCILSIQYRMWLVWDCDIVVYEPYFISLFNCMTFGHLVQTPAFCLLHPGLMFFSHMIKNSGGFFVFVSFVVVVVVFLSKVKTGIPCSWSLKFLAYKK